MHRESAAAPASDEIGKVSARYARRAADDFRYSLLNRTALEVVQERQRGIADLFGRLGWRDLTQIRLLEVGCGSGANLLEFLRLGFAPENLQGVELLAERAEAARRMLPAAVRIELADAASTEGLSGLSSQDVVYQATVFSSLLDNAFQQRLAERMWAWTKPGGGAAVRLHSQ